MASHLTVEFLRDTHHGGDAQQLQRVAGLLGDFIAAAKKSLDMAIYDFRLDSTAAATIVGALTDAAGRGVQVRIGYDAGKPSDNTTEAFAAAGADPAPVGTEQWLHDHFDGSPVQLKAIVASGHLMHDKYVVRDAASTTAAVWTGSANFTNDAWTRQENNILQITSQKLSGGYSKDFAEMWASGNIKGTGGDVDGGTTVDHHPVEWAFGPGDGPTIDAHLAALVSAAKIDVAVASMVLTSATILGALRDAIDRGVNVHGIYDSGQMDPIVKNSWGKSPAGKAKAALFQSVAQHLHAKKSTPYTPTSVHNFMHNKTLVIDRKRVATGSHNLSANATGNAENSLVLRDVAVANQYADYIALLEGAYPISG